MNRAFVSAALAVALFGSAAAYAASTATPSASTPPPPAAAAPAAAAAAHDYAGECKELGTQWEAAEAANATNAKLGKAQATANAAEKNCASTKASKQKTGISQYKAALKLLGVKPTT